MIERRTLLAGAIAAAGVPGVLDLLTGSRPTGRAGAPVSAGGPLRIGYLPITDASPLLVAHAQQRFTGVQASRPVLFRSWESLAQAFLADEVDVVHLLMPFAVQLRWALGARVRMVAWNHTGGSALTVGPGITEVGDLAGRRVAIPFWWSVHTVMLQRILRGAGLRAVVREEPSAAEGTVGLVVMSPADMLPALSTGAVSGYVVADPFNAAAEIRGVGRIARFVGDAWRDHACCVVVVRQELIDRAPAAVQAVTDGVAGAQQWIGAHRKDTAALLSGERYLPQPLPAITRALTHAPAEHAVNPGWSGERIGFAPFPFPGYTEALVGAMRETAVDGDRTFLDRIDATTAHTELTDDRFVRRSIDALGGPAAFGLPPSLTRTEEVSPI